MTSALMHEFMSPAPMHPAAAGAFPSTPHQKRAHLSPTTQAACSRHHAAASSSASLEPQKRGKGQTLGDRFIPQRSAMNMDISHFELTRAHQNENAGVNASPAKEEYKRELAANLFSGNASNKVLAFKSKAPAAPAGHQNSLRVLYTQNRDAGMTPKKYSRHIPQAPERILDAPELLDDYYLNLLDWNESNVLGGTRRVPGCAARITCDPHLPPSCFMVQSHSVTPSTCGTRPMVTSSS